MTKFRPGPFWAGPWPKMPHFESFLVKFEISEFRKFFEKVFRKIFENFSKIFEIFRKFSTKNGLVFDRGPEKFSSEKFFSPKFLKNKFQKS